ncbi:FAD-dependent oxidoreductase [Actinomycetospora chiangmaiensis]|uniref:FAD-dependent oxidoreductase n=1 Tax=Actinomycetospora chiangmaiensis TaxID=402650 RepID=UPI000372876D|nr:FAD-dependent oxidoreductase [Actinomycetospora chiangmaiensis]
MTRRIVVIGGDATGMSAANTALRHTAADGGEAPEVIVLERGHYTSYSACGIPYWIAGDVTGRDDLVARTPEQHREAGIDVRMRTEATAVDLDRQVVTFRALDGDGSEGELEYDDLVFATGAAPVYPPLDGIDADGIHGVQSLEQGEQIVKDLDASQARRTVVVGAGYIGVEMAEAMLTRGLEVTVLDRAPEPFTQIDPDLGTIVRTAMEDMGITVLTGTSVEGFDVREDGRVAAVRVRGERSDGESGADGAVAADIVVMGLGVAPNVSLAQEAGLTVGPSGGLVTDVRMRCLGHENVWAGGDCVEVHHRLSGKGVAIALGTHANKHGRIIGTNLAAGYGTFPGVIGTAISKVCSLEIGRTGLGEREATAAGYGYVTATIESSNVAGYMPGAEMMTVKVIAEERSGRLLGAQIVGRANSAKRIDVFATAIWNGMTLEEMTFMDLSYAPPFSPTWDAVLVAARKGAKAVQDDIPRSPV